MRCPRGSVVSEPMESRLRLASRVPVLGSADSCLPPRALCYLRLGLFEAAKQDCEQALCMEAGNVKALYRRALAQKGLQVSPPSRSRWGSQRSPREGLRHLGAGEWGPPDRLSPHIAHVLPKAAARPLQCHWCPPEFWRGGAGGG